MLDKILTGLLLFTIIIAAMTVGAIAGLGLLWAFPIKWC